MSAMRLVVRTAVAAVVLGVCVAAAWTTVRLLDGVGPTVLVGPTAAVAMTATAALSGGVLAALAATLWRGMPTATVVVVVLAAWLAEGVVLALVRPWLDGDIRGGNVPYLWLLATGFGLQPLAAAIGALAGGRLAGRRDPEGAPLATE